MSTRDVAPISDATLETVGDVLFPLHEDGLSLRDAGVFEYIHRLLDGHGAHLAPTYERGIEWLDELAREHGAARFCELDPAVRARAIDDLMRRAHEVDVPLGLSGTPIPTAFASLPEEIGFILTFWQHLREGLFCDPRHGGNADGRVWEWLGYRGPQLHGYTDSESLANEPLTRPLRTAEDWIGVDDE